MPADLDLLTDTTAAMVAYDQAVAELLELETRRRIVRDAVVAARAQLDALAFVSKLTLPPEPADVAAFVAEVT